MLLACLWLSLATTTTVVRVVTARRHQRHKSFSSDMEELGYRRMAAFNEHRDKSARSVPRKEIHIWGKRTISDSSLSLSGNGVTNTQTGD